VAKPQQPEPSNSQSLVVRVEWLLPVLISVAVAAVVLAIAISLHPRPPTLHDALGYTMTAQGVVDRRAFSFGVEPPAAGNPRNASATPGYVLFLAEIYGVSPSRSADATASALAIQPVVHNVQLALAPLIVASNVGSAFNCAC